MKNLSDCRNDFPSLSREYQGRPIVYLDGPAGSQVPQSVIDAISHYYQTCNANTHGQFLTTHETDEVMQLARTRAAQFLGADGPQTISFGQNMTTLCYSLSRAIGRTLKAGDEVLITQLDHEANRGPWLSLCELGVEVKEVSLLPEAAVLDDEDFERKVTEKTKLIALGYASNLTGTVNQVKKVKELAARVGALLVVDAVHYAPHFPIDVREIDCDFLLCSAYKFYGPHVGILYSKPGTLEPLPTDRLSTQEQSVPYRIETGTLNHAAIAGVTAAIDYLGSFGKGNNTREQLIDAMNSLHLHEHALGKLLYEGLITIPGVEIRGLDFSEHNRTPTISFFREGITAEALCKQLDEHAICGWDGHFYAERAVERMGLLEKGGVTRLGISMYTTKEEIEYTLAILGKIL